MRSAGAVLAIVVALATGACGAGDGTDDLTVFAASSLRDVLPAFEPDARYAFAGSDALATQVREGARADVLLSASARAVDELVAEGVVGQPVVFASNRLVVVIPAGSDDVTSFDDLVRPGIRLVLAGEGVPVGDYAREALGAAGLERALDNVVSFEESVSGVVAKVALGEADAGIVYATDADIAGDDIRVVPVPATDQPEIRYVGAAVVGGDRERATAYLDALRGERGRAALARAGFSLP